MATIPSLSRIVQEDFPDQKSWIGKLLQPVNQFMTQVVSAFSNNLTFSENLRAQITTVTVKGDLTFSPVEFKTKFTPVGLWPIKIVDKAASPAVVTAPIFVDWSFNPSTSLVTIDSVHGLIMYLRAAVSTGSPTISVPAYLSGNAMVGMTITNANFAAGTTVTAYSVSAGTITASANSSGTSAATDIVLSGKSYDLTLAVIGG